MPTLQTGVKAHDFTLEDQNRRKVSLRDFQGRWVVLYFYPKDNTPGCTKEAIEFTRLRTELEKLNAAIIGVSPDYPESHQSFIRKCQLNLTLLCDPQHTTMEAYGAWGPKISGGEEKIGAIRTTVLIAPNGDVAYHWANVHVDGHAEEVKAKLEELQTES